MVATLGGSIALLLGLAVLLLPLLATELSRPRDSAWGAVLLLLGLVLVSSSERLNGAPMLGVLCGGLLIARLGLEVGQGRWRQLSEEEQSGFNSKERWGSSLQQLAATSARLASGLQQAVSVLQPKPKAKTTGKRWVRPGEPEVLPPQAGPPQSGPAQEIECQVVSSLSEVADLLEAEANQAG